LTVYEGEATLARARRVTVQTGMRSYARREKARKAAGVRRRGERRVRALGPGPRGARGRGRRAAGATCPRSSTPTPPSSRDTAPGTTRPRSVTFWRPQVAVGWRPYTKRPLGVDGPTAGPGAGERWGWAASHYGRWVIRALWAGTGSPATRGDPPGELGDGRRLRGLCPLGRYDRPVYQPRQYGYAGARGASVRAGRSCGARRCRPRRRAPTGGDGPRGLTNVRIADSVRLRPTATCVS